jgi:DNA-binding transcriptional ArsR family regulator
MEQSLEDLSWVLRGKQRREILAHLSGPETPTEIAKKSGYSLNHTSRILGEFREKGIVKILNPRQKTGRLYQLSRKGTIIKDKLRRRNQR